MSQWSYHIPILGYHRVGAFKGDHVPTVSREAFERQMTCLARRGYRVVGLEDVARALDRRESGDSRGRHPESRREMARRSVAITFDDGYEETHSVAWPLLKRFGFSATVFVTPAEVGWPGFATWEQVRAMAQDGMVIGSHTMHHSYLPLVQPARLPEEIIQSKQVIEAQIQRPVRFISYPVGGFTAEVQTVVREAGYLAACTTNRVSCVKGMDRYALRRIKVTEGDGNLLLFSAKLSGYYDAFRKLKQPS